MAVLQWWGSQTLTRKTTKQNVQTWLGTLIKIIHKQRMCVRHMQMITIHHNVLYNMSNISMVHHCLGTHLCYDVLFTAGLQAGLNWSYEGNSTKLGWTQSNAPIWGCKDRDEENLGSRGKLESSERVYDTHTHINTLTHTLQQHKYMPGHMTSQVHAQLA